MSLTLVIARYSEEPECSMNADYGEFDEKMPRDIVLKACDCSQVGTMQCPANSYGPEPRKARMPSGDLLYDLNGRNLSDWLLKSRPEFFKRRYGGFEFGARNPLAGRNVSAAEEATDRWLKVRLIAY